MGDQMRWAKGPLPTAVLRTELQRNMQKYAPVYRNAADMEKGVVVIQEVMKKYKDVGIQDRSMIWNSDLIETLELENYPDRNDEEWMKHTLTWVDHRRVEEGKVVLKYRAVIDQPLDDEMHHVPPAKRVY